MDLDSQLLVNLIKSNPAEFARQYVQCGWPERDDPSDDLARLLIIADSCGLPCTTPTKQPSQSGARSKGEELIAYLSSVAHSACPELSIDTWHQLVDEVLRARYGRGKVRIKKRIAGMNASRDATIIEMMNQGEKVAGIARRLKISRAMVYKVWDKYLESRPRKV